MLSKKDLKKRIFLLERAKGVNPELLIEEKRVWIQELTLSILKIERDLEKREEIAARNYLKHLK